MKMRDHWKWMKERRLKGEIPASAPEARTADMVDLVAEFLDEEIPLLMERVLTQLELFDVAPRLRKLEARPEREEEEEEEKEEEEDVKTVRIPAAVPAPPPAESVRVQVARIAEEVWGEQRQGLSEELVRQVRAHTEARLSSLVREAVAAEREAMLRETAERQAVFLREAVEGMRGEIREELHRIRSDDRKEIERQTRRMIERYLKSVARGLTGTDPEQLLLEENPEDRLNRKGSVSES
jgi:hypothetical protein